MFVLTTGTLTRSYQYDAAGNTLSDGVRSLRYNGAGRLTSATRAGMTTSYMYNALGQRIQKATATGSTLFAYDEQGHLLGEYDQNGLVQELVWLDDIPVATLRTDQGGTNTGLFYIHTDHLKAPTKITRTTNNEVIWRWDHDPYGNGTPNEDPDGNGLTLAMNLRFPGQYYDAETGLYSNGFRDCYDPATGRYCQSDPMGLYGGSFSTFSYANNNPISFIDPLGLEAICNLLFKIDEKMQESRERTRVLAARFPWITGTPDRITFGPGTDIPHGGGLPGMPGAGVDWRVQLGWWEKMEITEYIIWTQYDLWKQQCQETSYDNCGKPSTRYWFDQKWMNSGHSTRDKSNTWTEWYFVPSSPTYTMPGPPF